MPRNVFQSGNYGTDPVGALFAETRREWTLARVTSWLTEDSRDPERRSGLSRTDPDRNSGLSRSDPDANSGLSRRYPEQFSGSVGISACKSFRFRDRLKKNLIFVLKSEMAGTATCLCRHCRGEKLSAISSQLSATATATTNARSSGRRQASG